MLNETNDVSLAILLKIMILVLLKNTHITTYTHSCLSVYRDKFVMTHNNINNGCLWGVRLDKTINYVALLLCKWHFMHEYQRWYVINTKFKIWIFYLCQKKPTAEPHRNLLLCRNKICGLFFVLLTKFKLFSYFRMNQIIAWKSKKRKTTTCTDYIMNSVHVNK